MRRLNSLTRRALLLALPLVAAVSGCSTATTAEDDVQLVADVDGQLFLALVADGDQVVGYSCDGTGDGATVFYWFFGSRDGDAFEIDGEGGSHLRGTFKDGAASGTLTVLDTDHAFTARASEGEDGLYLALTDDIKGTWVVIGAESRGAVITRTTGDLITGSSFNASGVTVNGIALTPKLILAPSDVK